MTLTEIQRALESLEAKPLKSLGQNFLHDQNIARWIVSQGDIQPGDHVVEIGPGLGALSRLIRERCERLTLLEKDAAMARWLRESMQLPGVELFHGDALDFDLRNLYGNGPVKVIGNLPYYISSPLIAKFASALSPASILVLMLQHEVAERMGATIGTPESGAMTVCTQRRWKVRYLRKVPASCFFPAPKVASAVVIMERKPASEVPPCDEELFESLVRGGFSQRRKQLKNLLPQARENWSEICRTLDLPETCRAEDLSLKQWVDFARILGGREAQRGQEMFDIVDESDRVMGQLPREEVHVNNLRHRAVHMLLFNKAGEIFLQKRSMWKDKNPFVWDSSAAGHVDTGETYEQAAVRELREEIGATTSLTSLGKLPNSPQTGWEFIEVFFGQSEGPFSLDRLEVETGAFFPIDQVEAWTRQSPRDFSSVFLLVLELWRKAGGTSLLQS